MVCFSQVAESDQMWGYGEPACSTLIRRRRNDDYTAPWGRVVNQGE